MFWQIIKIIINIAACIFMNLKIFAEHYTRLLPADTDGTSQTISQTLHQSAAYRLSSAGSGFIVVLSIVLMAVSAVTSAILIFTGRKKGLDIISNITFILAAASFILVMILAATADFRY